MPSTAPSSWFSRHHSRLGWIAAAAVFVLAAALRLGGLGEYWLNPDEGIYYSVISWPELAQRQAEIAENAHPPLYYHFLWLWGRASMELWWLRLPAALAGIAAVVATFWLGRELMTGGRGVVTGLVAALLLAISPAAIVLSKLIRPYSLQVALICFALVGLARWHRTHGRGSLALFALAATFALLTHFSSVFALAAAGVALLAGVVAARPPRRALTDLAVALALPLATVSWIWFVHVRPLSGHSLQTWAFATWLRRFLADDLAHAWRQALGVAGYLLGEAWSGVGILALLLALALAVWQRAHALWLAPLAAFALAAAASLLHKYPFGPARHSVWLAPFLLLPIAWAVARGALARPAVRVATAAAIALAAWARYPIWETMSGGLRISTLGDEQVLARADFERAQPLLAQLQNTPGLLVMSTDGYHTLCPLFQDARLHGRVVEGMRQFRWGQRDVLVHSEWSFSMQGSELGSGAHLYDFLVKAERVYPELGVARQRRLAMLFAGFHGMFEKALMAFDQMRGGNERLVLHFTGVKGLGLLELDAARFFAEASASLTELRGQRGGGSPGR